MKGEWCYFRRRRMDPLLNVSIVGGFDSTGKKFLGYIDPHGTLLEGDFLVGGLAQYFCKVLLSSCVKPNMTEADARAILEQCMRVLVYRDARASEEIQFCTVTTKGTVIEKPYSLKSKWDFKAFVEQTNDKIHSMTF